MAVESKKISFGFSKVSKKNTIIQPKKENEDKNDIQFIECLEEKSIKLVGGEEEMGKELLIIPMRNGNLLRESIKEVIKSRTESKESLGTGEIPKEPLTLDELAAKELVEDSQKNDTKTEETPLTVPIGGQPALVTTEPSSLDDYESMPIADFGLAMLRGMGWNPEKGIGLNEKIVTPLAPALRPKGMGLGADKVPVSKSIASNGEILIMKKGASVKIISGPYKNLYGRIEGFDELPGRLMVRISPNNIISLNEIMVQLVSTNEFVKHVENVQLKNEVQLGRIPNRALSEKKRLNKAEISEMVSSKNSDSKRVRNISEENVKMDSNEKYTKKNIDSKKYSKHKKLYKERRSRSSSSDESYYKHRKTKEEKGHSHHKKIGKHKYKRHPSPSSPSSSSSLLPISRKIGKKASRQRKHEDNNSSDSDGDRVKKTKINKDFVSSSSSRSRSRSKEKIKHSSKYKNYYNR